jgi:hypothetical protein
MNPPDEVGAAVAIACDHNARAFALNARKVTGIAGLWSLPIESNKSGQTFRDSGPECEIAAAPDQTRPQACCFSF